MKKGSWQMELRRRINAAAYVALRAWRVVCCGVAIALFGIWLWRIGQGIAAVSAGEMTPAQMLENMGTWLRGFEQ